MTETTSRPAGRPAARPATAGPRRFGGGFGPVRQGVRGWLVLVLLLLLAVVLLWVVAFSSILGVAAVQVRGNTTLTAAQIEQQAAIPSGKPLIRLDTATARARVLALPQIKTATVTTSYPHTVTITVTQRTAVGYRTAGGTTKLVDVDDVAFEPVSSPPKKLPQLVAGEVAADDMAIATAAGALSASVAAQVTAITAQTPESVTLALADGRVVLWGGADRGADKARLLSALLSQPGHYFDISDPSTVISR